MVGTVSRVATDSGGAVKSTEHDELTAAPEDGYEPPELTEYGTIEAWTRGARDINISIIL
jgi:hypothetical protein